MGLLPLLRTYGVGGSCRPHQRKTYPRRSGRTGRAEPGRTRPDRWRHANVPDICAVPWQRAGV